MPGELSNWNKLEIQWLTTNYITFPPTQSGSVKISSESSKSALRFVFCHNLSAEYSLVSLSLQGQANPTSQSLLTCAKRGKKVCNRILNRYDIIDLKILCRKKTKTILSQEAIQCFCAYSSCVISSCKIPIERVCSRWKGSGFSIGNYLQALSVTALTATPSCQKKDLSSKLPMLSVLIPHNWFCHVTLYLQKYFFSLHTAFSHREFLVGRRGHMTTSGSFLLSCPGAMCLPQDMSQPSWAALHATHTL